MRQLLFSGKFVYFAIFLLAIFVSSATFSQEIQRFKVLNENPVYAAKNEFIVDSSFFQIKTSKLKLLIDRIILKHLVSAEEDSVKQTPRTTFLQAFLADRSYQLFKLSILSSKHHPPTV